MACGGVTNKRSVKKPRLGRLQDVAGLASLRAACSTGLLLLPGLLALRSLLPMDSRTVALVFLAVLLAAVPVRASAQETAAQEAALRSAVLKSLPGDAARRVFGTVTTPAAGEATIVGEYWKGCFGGGVELPVAGNHWQVMRLSRGRNWGHPALVSFLRRFAKEVSDATGWPGLLIGDLAQPRGGPMLTGHSSHQVGLDADVWLRPMPSRRLNNEEVENMLSTSLLRSDRRDVDPDVYTRQHFEVLRAAAREPQVARVFVNAGIKKALCRDAGSDRAWLAKIRPAAGHDYHFHIRLACPAEQPGCIDQAPPPDAEGCGKDLDHWFTGGILHPKPGARTPISIASMPKACQQIVAMPAAPGAPLSADSRASAQSAQSPQ